MRRYSYSRRPLMRRRTYTRSRALTRPRHAVRTGKGGVVSLRRQVYASDPSTFRIVNSPFARYNSMLSPFPPVLEADFEYVTTGTLSSTGSTPSTGSPKVFNMNSLYSPEFSGGHQPRYYDQLTNIYGRYRVSNFAFQLTYNHPSSTTIWVCAAITNSLDAFSLSAISLQNAKEVDGGWVQFMPADDTPLTITYSTSIAAADQVSMSEWNGPDYEALVSAKPGRVPSLQYAAGDYTSPAGTQTVYYTIKCIYRAKLWGRNFPSAS